eukprot:c16554_g1_i2 orf=245-1417(-)
MERTSASIKNIVFCLSCLIITCWIRMVQSDCPQYAIFAFGDSLTDTGNAQRTGSRVFVTATLPPYGETYFKKPTDRFSDGRLMVDFLAQSLGLELVNPYLNFDGTDFSNGVVYAVAGATLLDISILRKEGVFAPLPITNKSIEVQLEWHYNILRLASAGSVVGTTKLPNASAITQGMYFIEIGGDDLTYFFVEGHTQASVQSKNVPALVAGVSNLIERLYETGARNFFVINTTPEGCTPLYAAAFRGPKDDVGCMYGYNVVDKAYTVQLEAALQTLRLTLPLANIVFLNLYDAVDYIIRNPAEVGLVNTMGTCCGAANIHRIAPNNFSIFEICSPVSSLCADPNQYVNWDGIHLTDNMSRIVVNFFTQGRFITPPDALSACGARYIEMAQ